jgi:general secretion pathway protein D
MNRFNGNDPGLRKFDLHGVREERTLRTRFAFFAITAAGVGTLAALSGRPLHADDAPVAGPAVQSRAVAPADSSANQAYKKTAKNILAEADRLAAAGELQKAAVLAHRAATLPVQWQASERTPQQLLVELAARAGQDGAAMAQNDSPSMTVLKKHRYVSALLDTARDELQLGRLDLAKAKAAAAHKIETAYKFLDSRAGQLLTEIDRLSHRAKPATPAASEPLVVRGQSPSAAESPSDFQDFDKSGQPKAPVAPPASPVVNAKAQAKRLLVEARVAFDKGAYDEARIKALKADEFEVKWNVLEDQPQTLLAEIERTTGTKTFARRTKRPSSESTDPRRAQAVELIRQARADLQAGRFADATKKAQQARQQNAAFGMFEDRPDTVLADIARAQRVHDLTAGTGPKAQDNWGEQTAADKQQTGSAAESQKAQDLLLKAREDLRAGHVDAARQKAQQVAKMNVAYTPFDDRPELVLESISIRDSQSGRPVGPDDAQPSEVRQAVAQDSGDQSPFTVNQVSHQGAQPVAPNAKWNKERATNLVREARQDLKHGRIAEARRKAKEAATLDVAYSVMDDRPELVLSDIERAEAEGSVAKSDAAPALPAVIDAPAPPTVAEMPPAPMAAVAMPAAPASVSAMPSEPETPAPSPSSYTTKPAATPAEAFTSENPFSGEKARPAVVAVIAPTGASADELFELGMRELREGHRDNAYAAFLQCYHSGQQLADRSRDRQLHDFLRDLAPLRSRNVQQVSAQLPSSADSQAQPRRQTASRIDIADQQRALKFEKLRTDVLNAHFKAERVKDSDPAKAIKLLNDAIANVDRSDLGKEAVAPLMTLLARSKADIEAQQKTQAPVAVVKAKNEKIKGDIEHEQAYHVRVEQEFADLVEEYNKLCKQDRWTEAEQIAKQAKELDKENPTAEIMFQKARIGRENARIADLKIRKEDNFLGQLWEVEDAAATPMFGSPYKFPKDWADLTRRRKGKYGADNKQRSEPEKQIEQSLSRQVSLHFEKTPLVEVIRHIQKIADVNIVLDTAALEEEHVPTSTEITIGVDGITLRSALNLILEPLNMGYMVKNEVLNITSRLKQQGETQLLTYPVADLVMPISNTPPTVPFQRGTGGAQFVVPSADSAQQGSGQAMFQVGQTLGTTAPLAGAAANGVRPAGAPQAPDFDTIKHLIVSTIEPESWDEAGGQGHIQSNDSTLSLVIRQTQKVHDEIRDLLQQLRRLQDLQVTVETRFITVDDNFFESVGVNFNFNVNDNVSQSTLGLGQFGAPIFSGGTTSTSGTSTSSTSGTSTSSTSGTSTSSTSGTSTSSTSSTSGTSGGGFAPFNAFPFPLNLPNVQKWPSQGTVVGMDSPTTFSQDLTVPFRQGSFDIGIPQFGNFNPAAGMTVGLAVLSDIETFFFIRAAQGDTRTNVMFAPKVTLFNGQRAFVANITQRPFVTSVTPTVGVFAVGFTPEITLVPSGVSMSVAAVVSADRRFVRLAVVPNFSVISDVFTFTFLSAPGQSGAQGMGPGASGSAGSTGSTGFGGGTSGSSGFGGIGGSSTSSTSGTTGSTNTNNSLAVGNITVQQPVVQTVTVITTVSVPDGGTVLLGGIKTLREGRNEAGVPILNQLPYINRLFRNTGIGRETESLMMMVTPRIIIQEEEEELLESSGNQ